MPIFPALVSNSGGTQPGPPTAIGLTTAGAGSLQATWTAPEFLGKHPLTNYVILLFTGAGVLINDNYATVAHPATSLTVSGLSSSTTYSIRVRLQNSIGFSSDVSAASPNATTSSAPPPPPPPPVYTTWYCSYNGTDGRARTIQSSDLTDTSGCDYAVVCSPFGYPEYPSYVGCAGPPPPPPCSGSFYCGQTTRCCSQARLDAGTCNCTDQCNSCGTFIGCECT